MRKFRLLLVAGCWVTLPAVVWGHDNGVRQQHKEVKGHSANFWVGICSQHCVCHDSIVRPNETSRQSCSRKLLLWGYGPLVLPFRKTNWNLPSYQIQGINTAIESLGLSEYANMKTGKGLPLFALFSKFGSLLCTKRFGR